MGSNAPPPEEGMIRAAELWGQQYPLRHVAELLRAEGYNVKSHETARQWALTGQQLQASQQLLDNETRRARQADGLEQDMAALRELVRTGQADVLDVMPHLKWLWRELARVNRTDPAVNLNVNQTGEPKLDRISAEGLRRAQAEAEASSAALRNGRRP